MIGSWLAERFSWRTFVPVSLVLALAAAGGLFAPLAFARDAGAALLLLLEFRVWDDLADRHADAVSHPGRVLVRADSLAPLVLLCLVTALANAVLAALSDATGVSFTAFVFLHMALGVWYLHRRGRTAAGDHLLLAKYPVFVCILAGERLADAPVAVLLGAAAVYAGACLYEARHDPQSPLAAYLGGRS